ncbi:MAG: hypothetical protein ACLP8V_04470 [Thermoplasmata archaeon]
MGAPIAYQMPPPMMAAEPPEVQSIKTMLHIAKILAIILGILVLLGGIAYGVTIAFLSSNCSVYGNYCGSALAGALIGAVYLVIMGVVAIIVYMQMNSIEGKVNDHQYEAAKSQTLLWMILGFIFGIILGVILLVAWLKFDPLITWQRNQGAVPAPGYPPQYAAPVYAAPAPAAAPMATAPPPAPAAAPPAQPTAPFCVKCGKPTTYIAQYGRYYCYADNLYV